MAAAWRGPPAHTRASTVGATASYVAMVLWAAVSYRVTVTLPFLAGVRPPAGFLPLAAGRSRTEGFANGGVADGATPFNRDPTISKTPIAASVAGAAALATVCTVMMQKRGRGSGTNQTRGGLVACRAKRYRPKEMKLERGTGITDPAEFVRCLKKYTGSQPKVEERVNNSIEEEEEEPEDAGASEAEDDLNISDTDLDGTEVKELSEQELARRGERQLKFELYPASGYLYKLAKYNAVTMWARSGPDGRKLPCLESRIAILTENIRRYVLHIRENPKDIVMRRKLVRLVAFRRQNLDKLSWRDLDSYLKIRTALKIRHTYRMETLIGRLNEYKYASLHYKLPAFGRKTLMRYKKSRRLLEKRLATQLKQGKSKYVIRQTQMKLKGRSFYSLAHDDAKNLIKGKPVTKYVNPLGD